MSKTVMVIDDAPSIRQVVALVLGEEGYTIIEAQDGQDAVDKLSATEEVKIDCIVCDVNMPNMNGIEFLDKLKNDASMAAYKFVPIIMLTTEAGESMKEKGKALGAKAWLIKPFQPEQLLESIKKLIG